LHSNQDMAKETNTLNARSTAEWKAQQRRILVSRVVRWSIALPLIIFCFPIPWFGPFLILLGAIMIAPDIASYLASLFQVHHRAERKPVYGIAESLVARGKYADAEQEYEKIIQEFPGEVKPHVDMINIAVRWLNDGQLAEKLYQRGMTLLRDPAARTTLTEMYEGMRTRLKSPDAESNRTISNDKLKDVQEHIARDRRKLWR